VTLEKRPLFVHIITHGPHCLDGVAAAVAIARARPQAEILPWFVHNHEVNDAVRELRCGSDVANEVWITDVSWTDRQADRHLRGLAERGARVFWVDHHRTAIERFEAGEVDVPFAASVVSERYAASRLVYEYLGERDDGALIKRFRDFWPVVERADDTDRWIHAIEGSHDLALTVRAMGSTAAYDDLLSIDRAVTYTPRMRAALERVGGELQRSRDAAERQRFSLRLPSGLVLVTSVCHGYPSEVADAWGRVTPNAVFALYDAKFRAVSLRRSPDCAVDLSRLARRFGGGGHPAAAGCELPWVGTNIPRGMADLLGPALAHVAD